MDLLTYLLTVARYDKSIGCFGHIRCSHGKYVFVSEQNDANIIGWKYFDCTVLNGSSALGQCDF